MKIGILTFHRAINYGAFLQAFALKTYLSSLGHEVEVVDYWPEGHADAYRLLPHTWKKRSLIGKIKFFISFVLRYTRAKKRRDGMQRLVRKYFGLSDIPNYRTPETLTNLSCDCVIYGSDQIWWKSTIPGYLGFDPVYWGDYVSNNIRKIAYAPSMGIIDLTERDKDLIKKWLTNFDALSVRESALARAISSLTEQKISLVLDPVFLLSSAEWESYCIHLKIEKYILYYNLIPTEESKRLVKELSTMFNCKVLEITGDVKPFKIGKYCLQTINAIEFISLIRNSCFVVTSSFHGTAFSILFRRQFYAIGMGQKSGRVSSLLSKLDLDDRLLKTCPDEASIKMIDYDRVTEKLNQLVIESMSFIKQSLY